MNVSELVEEIKVVLDENTDSTALSSIQDVDTLKLGEVIQGVIPAAARAVIEMSPADLLSDIAESLSGEVVWGTIGGDSSIYYGTVTLPTDFLRLVWFKASDWSYGVSEAISPLSPLYPQQFNKYTCGNKEKPVVAIRQDSSQLKLEFFTCGSSSATVEASYVKIPAMTHPEGEEEQIAIGKHLHYPTVYYAAYLVALTMKDEHAANLKKQCIELLYGTENSKG